jgi:hypothetical protein
MEIVFEKNTFEFIPGKTLQGNAGKHVFEHNIWVVPAAFPEKKLEFEMTRNLHMKEMPGRPYTETACFKDVGKEQESLYIEAYRILLAATEGKQLLPEHCKAEFESAKMRVCGAVIPIAEVSRKRQDQ